MQDAHIHLQDPRYADTLTTLIAEAKRIGVQHAVVNGTCPEDWGQVQKLANEEPNFVLPAYGLHPWKISQSSELQIHTENHWLPELISALEKDPRSSVGECGLDRWIKGHNLPLQLEVFRKHLEVAFKYDRPISVHCLKAWGSLIDTLKSSPSPSKGIVLHSFGGSKEMVKPLLDLGCYFSFSGYFLHSRKQKVQDAYRLIPFDRLLVETDAPDMLPPNEVITNAQAKLLSPMNHPANLAIVVEGLANILNLTTEELQCHLTANFKKVFQT